MSEKIDDQREQEEKLDTSQAKKPFTEPKLTFIEPKLTKHGDVTKTTAQNGFLVDLLLSSMRRTNNK